MNWFIKRLSEPSTWAGLAAVAVGAGGLGKVNEAPGVADALLGAGQAVASGMPWWQAAIVAVGGVGAVFLGEKGGR